MKLLSIVIPCYNSESYMRKCIDSLLPGGEDVEIIIVDDGSHGDRTAEIADEYAALYPTVVKAVHQLNGGHGAAVETLREQTGTNRVLDMLICNFVYEKEGENRKKVMNYRHILPTDQLFGWEDCHHFTKGHYILMHSVIFRTKLLRECGLELPAHTFYVDNLYVFEPLPYVENMYYLDVNFYRYYIGREDQSVNETVMISRIDQQIFVNKRMIDYFTELSEEIRADRRLYQYMYNYLEIITTVSSVLLLRSGTKEHLAMKRELWEYLKGKDKRLFGSMRRGIMGAAMNLPGRGGRRLAVDAYHICQKIFKFN